MLHKGLVLQTKSQYVQFNALLYSTDSDKKLTGENTLWWLVPEDILYFKKWVAAYNVQMPLKMVMKQLK